MSKAYGAPEQAKIKQIDACSGAPYALLNQYYANKNKTNPTYRISALY